jgi:hypothetical protein
VTDEELKGLFEAARRETAAAFEAARQETAAGFAAVRQETSAGFAAVRQETAAEFAAIREENAATRRENAELHVETRRHFEIVAERLNKRVDFAVEGIAAVDQKLDRNAADIREEMRSGFADTQALITFSHTGLDRRVHALEDKEPD